MTMEQVNRESYIERWLREQKEAQEAVRKQKESRKKVQKDGNQKETK